MVCGDVLGQNILRMFCPQNILREPTLGHFFSLASNFRTIDQYRHVVLGLYFFRPLVFLTPSTRLGVPHFTNLRTWRSNQEEGPSTGPLEPLGPRHFRNISSFPAANNPTQLTKQHIQELYANYHVPMEGGGYHLYMPKTDDRIYHTSAIASSFRR